MDIPEIRLMVGRFLYPSDIASCARVCKIWCDTFTALLWSDIECASFDTLPPKDVIEKYACYIRALNIMDNFTQNGFSTTCTRLQRLNVTSSYPFNQFWGHLASFICQNPDLQSLEISACDSIFANRVIPPQFMATWTGSSMRLKCLKLRKVELNAEALNLLLDLTLRLNILEVESVDINELGSMDRWSSFPHLESLSLGVRIGLPSKQAIRWSQKCPRLKVFEYTAQRYRAQTALLPVDDIVDLFLRTCPLLEHLTLWRHYLEDNELARILEACPRMTFLCVPETGFGPLAFEALVRHFSYLQGLNIEQCQRVTNAMCQRILVSCPELRKFYANCLNVGDVIRTASEKASTQQLLQQQQQQAGEEDGSETILPQGWVCTKMEIMHVYFCGPEDGPQDWQRWVMEQISKLTRLEVLCIDPPSNYFSKNYECGVQLRLENGLEMLSGLKRLEDVSVADQSMDQEDIHQILRMWPALNRLFGEVHHKMKKQDELSEILWVKEIEVQPQESLRQDYYYMDYVNDSSDSSEEENEDEDVDVV